MVWRGKEELERVHEWRLKLCVYDDNDPGSSSSRRMHHFETIILQYLAQEILKNFYIPTYLGMYHLIDTGQEFDE